MEEEEGRGQQAGGGSAWRGWGDVAMPLPPSSEGSSPPPRHGALRDVLTGVASSIDAARLPSGTDDDEEDEEEDETCRLELEATREGGEEASLASLWLLTKEEEERDDGTITGWTRVASVRRITARRIPPPRTDAAPARHADPAIRGWVEVALELEGEGEPENGTLRLPAVPMEITDKAIPASEDQRTGWGCCQITTNALLFCPTSDGSPSRHTMLVSFSDTWNASNVRDYIYYLSTVTRGRTEDADEEQAEDEDQEERVDYDSKYTFIQNEYWEYFHEETGEDCFDWYTAEELQRNCIIRSLHRTLTAPVAERGPLTYRILDIGADMLFNLYEKILNEEAQRAPSPFSVEIWGIDFSRTAIEFMQTQKWQRHHALRSSSRSVVSSDRGVRRKGAWPGIEVYFRGMDALDLSFFPAHYFHMITDKGCLDCFVNGAGRALTPTSPSLRMIPRYFQQINDVLRPDGHFLLIAASNIDLPLLLQTGGEVAQRAIIRQTALAKEELHLNAEEKQNARQQHQSAPGRLVVEEVRAKGERHAIMARPATAEDGADAGQEAEAVLVCEECDRRYALASLPKRCARCANQLQRFLVSA